MTTLVEKGDVIEFYKEPQVSTEIKWQQNFKDRSEVFLTIPYKVKDKEASGSLFVEQKMADKFMKAAKKVETNKESLFKSSAYTITINEDFQYGQDKEKTIRFLVYHDKNENIYQHRFASNNAFQKIVSKIGEQTDKIESVQKIFDKITRLGKAYLGDKLKDF